MGGTIAAVRSDGFDFNITERQATISLPLADDGVAEGSETATFTIEPNDPYQINPAATEVTFALADTPDQATVPEESESNSTLPEANPLVLARIALLHPSAAPFTIFLIPLRMSISTRLT